MLIRKDQDILSFIKPLIESGYQVLFDNDREDSEYYWIKVNHPEWDEARFELVGYDQYIEDYNNNKLEDLFKDYEEINGYKVADLPNNPHKMIEDDDESPYDKWVVEDK